MTRSNVIVQSAAAAALFITASLSNAQTSRMEVKPDTEEAEAVLALVDRGSGATERGWQRLFATDGYRRLKEREAAMRRPFTDS
jgi:hypothetical protein